MRYIYSSILKSKIFRRIKQIGLYIHPGMSEEKKKKEEAKIKLREKLIKKFTKGETNANKVYSRLSIQQSEILSNMAVEIFRQGKSKTKD